MLTKILAYFIPFAVNFLQGGFFFITSYRFSQAGCSGVIIGSSLTAWGVAYCLITMVISRLVKISNALRFILSGGGILVLSALGFIIFAGVYTQFLWLVTAGIGAALFCAPFQIFAKSIESGSKKSAGTVSATSFYTMTWSAGFASGPLAFARLSVRGGFIVTLIFSLAIVVSVLLIARQKKKQTTDGGELPENSAAAENIHSEKYYTRLAILGWIVGGLGTVTVCQLRSMWPKLGTDLSISRYHIACILALVSFSQAAMALLLCRSRDWMTRRFPAFLMNVPGIAALLIFAFAGETWCFYLAALLYGVYSGCMYFYLVYHSLAHPVRNSFFVAGNEVIVGITSMVAPFIGGMLVDLSGSNSAPFIFAAAVIFLAFMLQWWILSPRNLQEEQR